MARKQIPTNAQALYKKQDNDDRWIQLDDGKLLAQYGFNVQNARAENPAVIALSVMGGFIDYGYLEDNGIIIEPISTPPPIPDSMRTDQPTTE